MFEILTLNEISDKIYNVFDNNYIVSKDFTSPDAILVRSFQMADYPINDNLLAVARAGAGVNNIPLDRMTEAGV
ncbi:MAG TPA: 3-phosphoglycerate dehydrogenase, partial [Clostridia bacterium]|nr:3-phosphoglycerate dehydrogenase [Clostridia bacterium]